MHKFVNTGKTGAASCCRTLAVVKSAILALALSAGAAFPLSAGTLQLPYYSPTYTMGNSYYSDTSSTLTATPKLAYSGMTLDDVQALVDDGYVFGAYQCGTSHYKGMIESKTALTCRDPETDAVVKIVVLFIHHQGGHTKCIAVELTNGDGGVYARIGRVQYIADNAVHLDFVFAELDGNGGVIYSCDTDNPDKAATSGTSIAGYGTAGYGISGLSIVKVAPADDPIRIWHNASGEQALTVEDIKDYDFTARFCGNSIATNRFGATMQGYNKHVETNALGVATSIRVEFQNKDDGHLKCAVVEFTNGDGGVYAQQTHAIYLTGGTAGYNFFLEDGTLNTITKSSIPGHYGYFDDSFCDYAAFNISAVPPSQPAMLWNKAENMISKTHNVPDVSKLPLLTRTWVKVLDGISLQEMINDGYELSAYFCGGSVNTKQKVYAKNFHSYTPPGETSISKAICSFAIYDSGKTRYTKSASVLFESRPDGVYAQYGKGQYFSANNANFDFAWLDENGNPVYDCNQASPTASGNNNVPSSWTATGYGIAGLKASRFMKQNESRLVFANPAGEPVLTLDDIKDYYLGCSFAGSSISVKDGEGIGMYRAFEYDGNDSVSLMRVEYQVYDGGHNKCSIVNFTNGVDGVYGYAASARYAGSGTGKIGYHFVNANGTFAGTGGTVVTNSFTGGYGIYDLFATPMVVLDRDTDWSGTDGVIPLGDAVVDLAGHNLTLQGVSGNGTLQYPYSQIFNSTNNVMAEVHFKVSGGLTFNNNSIRFGTSDTFLNSNIKFVKEGHGTHVAAIGQPVCKGGTEIAAGTLAAGVIGSEKPFGVTTQAITIPAGCAFDVNGQYDFGNYSFVVNGGAIINSGASVGPEKAQLKTVSLTADSAFTSFGAFGMIGSSYSATTVDLGGHTLSVDVGHTGARVYLCNSTFATSGGVVDITGGGYLQVGLNYPDQAGALNTNEARTVDFRVGCCLNVLSPFNVHDYVALNSVNANSGNETINVFGTFKPSPTHNYFHGCMMQDGSTIDLSERMAAIPLVSAFTNEESDRTLKFADGATVYIDLPAQKLSGGKVISWEEKPDNIGTVKFRHVPGSTAKGYFAAKDDGLYLASGFIILVR